MNRKSMLVMYRFPLFVAMTAIFFLATTPLRIPVADSIHDKIKHAAAFFVLALLMDHSFPERAFRSKTLALISYGLAIEVTQSFLPYRSCSLFDLGADTLGLTFYGLLIPWLAER